MNHANHRTHHVDGGVHAVAISKKDALIQLEYDKLNKDQLVT